MQEKKFTKGLWNVIEHNWYDTSIRSENRVICHMSIYDEATEETQDALEDEMSANARLIAAAPELLEMLERAKTAMGMIRRSISAHPDCTEDSEFNDMADTAQELEVEMGSLIQATVTN